MTDYLFIYYIEGIASRRQFEFFYYSIFQIIAALPECHGNVFRYLTSFLRELLRNNIDNKLEARMLGL